GSDVPLALLQAAGQAVRERRLMRIRYHTLSRDEVTEREIEPHFLANVRGDWMLVAWDRLTDDDRTFLLARVMDYTLLEERFARRPALEEDAYDRSRFLTHYSQEAQEVALRFDAYKAR